eukprot:TRINITY_DN39509_c0_g1_i1.p1 TRINITY_DN39509_c0_g1~~TRINITY_DN39509_c0_g1_i1.p1  ORF type:complete len:481 (-),score=85.33 TRINITY_DN39509_c0_g1_i1:108-1550(-)
MLRCKLAMAVLPRPYRCAAKPLRALAVEALLLWLLARCCGAPRPSGPCSEWFDNAWLKERGYSADVCCWRNHPDCWQDGHSFDTCCADYDLRPFEDSLQMLEQQRQSDGIGDVDAALAARALAVSPESLRGTALDGALPPEGLSDPPAYARPRDFFRAAVPAARLAAQMADRAAADSGTDEAKIVLFITSGPGNFARRSAIRRTWLRTLLEPGAAGVRYTFVLGAPDARDRERIAGIDTQLLEEQRRFGDVLLLSLVQDVYWGWEHTAKTFLGIVAAYARVPAAYYACLHDDVFVHLPRLVELVMPFVERSVEDEGIGDSTGLYIGNAYVGHDFVGFREGPAYEQMHGHRKMPPVMKGGLWLVDRIVARWLTSMMAGPAAELPWRLWPSDDDSVGLVFGELDLRRVHALRHGVEWFDWRLGDRCDGGQLVVAHDLKTPRELVEMWLLLEAYGDPCRGLEGGVVRPVSRPESFADLAGVAA